MNSIPPDGPAMYGEIIIKAPLHKPSFATNIYIRKYNSVFTPPVVVPRELSQSLRFLFCLLMETCMNYYSDDKTFSYLLKAFN